MSEQKSSVGFDWAQMDEIRHEARMALAPSAIERPGQARTFAHALLLVLAELESRLK